MFVQSTDAMYYKDYYFEQEGIIVHFLDDQLVFHAPINMSQKKFRDTLTGYGFSIAKGPIKWAKTEFISFGRVRPCKIFAPVLTGPLPVPSYSTTLPVKQAVTQYDWLVTIKGFEIAAVFTKTKMAAKVVLKLKEVYGCKTPKVAIKRLLEDLDLTADQAKGLLGSTLTYALRRNKRVETFF